MNQSANVIILLERFFFLALPAGMKITDFLVPCGAVYMGIDLSGGNAFMPEHFLHHTQIRSVFHKMSCKGMPECVRRNFLADVTDQCLTLYHLEDGLTAERFSETVQEHKVISL